MKGSSIKETLLALFFSRLLQPHKNYFFVSCVPVCLLLAPSFGFTGPEVPAISFCQILKKKQKKRKMRKKSPKREMTKKLRPIFFLWRLHSLWNRSRRTREYIRKEDCTKSWVIIHNKQTAVERKIRRRSSTPKRTTKMRCGIAHTTHNKKRLGRWTRTWESVSSLHSTSTDIKTCSLFTTTNYHSVFLPLNWNERKNNNRTKNVSGIPSWKRIAFWGTLFWSVNQNA